MNVSASILINDLFFMVQEEKWQGKLITDINLKEGRW